MIDKRSDLEIARTDVLDRLPWIFAEKETAHRNWQTQVAQALGIQPEDVRIVGSAATGFSISPLKLGRAFRAASTYGGSCSDVDIAFVSEQFFTSAWNDMVRLERSGPIRSGEERSKIRQDIYWGHIYQRNVPHNTPSARKLLTSMAIAGREPPLRGYKVACRVYRRYEDLQSYTANSIRQVRNELIKETQNG
jgi:hypothetical protein